MRILFISRFNKQDCLGGGQEMVMHTYAKHLTEMGHTVATASYKLTKESKKVDKDVECGYVIYRVRGILTSFVSRLAGYINVVKKFDPDVIILPSIQHSMYGWYISKITGKKVVGILNDEFEIHGYGIKPFNYLYYINEHFFVHRISKVVALNHNSANVLEKETGVKSSILTTPLDMPSSYSRKTIYRNYSDDGPPFTFVFLGRMYEGKGPGILAETFVEYNKLFPNSRCVFIGSGAYLDELKRKYGSNPKIEILGYVEEQKMYKILSEADVLVNPTYIKEGIVLVNIQAMKVGLPVISSDSGASSEAVIHMKTGILTSPKNSPQLLNCMIGVGEDYRPIQAMADNAKEESKKYDGENCTKQFLEELNEL